MTNLQTYFNKFHKAIMLKDIEDNKILRDKRDIIIKKIRDGLEKKRKEGEKVPTFTFFNQGSYAMGTGIKPPPGGDYDIDVGLSFNATREDYPDPVVLKKMVYETVEGHTSEDDVKDPCIRIQYKKKGEDAFHVDLPIYATEEDDLYLGRGKLHSNPENKIWEDSEPKKLIKLIRDRFTDDKELQQFRRLVRYTKRWKDVKFSLDDHAAPTGIALTIAAYNYMNPVMDRDPFSGRCSPDDSKALLDLLNAVLGRFQHEIHNGEYAERIRVNIIVKPHNDLFAKMTNQQMSEFKTKLTALRDSLVKAIAEPDPHEACKLLEKHFGPDFPVPEKKDTGDRRGPAMVSHSSSA